MSENALESSGHVQVALPQETVRCMKCGYDFSIHHRFCGLCGWDTIDQ